MNILLLGSRGQVGSAWSALSKTSEWPKGFHLIEWDRALADLSDPEKLLANLEDLQRHTKIGIIINGAAYTQVDLAETDRKTCRAINALSPENIAEFCFDHGIILLQYSSDYVYLGDGHDPHHEDEAADPQNYYGLTKSEADDAIEASGAKYLIFRTSWVYSFTGKNFVFSMLKLGRERKQLKVVSDQVGAPTYAPDLALYSLLTLKKAFVFETLAGEFPSGIYHLCNSGETSWHGFAQEIFTQARKLEMPLQVKEVLPIPASEYPTPAKRPQNSRLCLDKIKDIFQITPRSWQEGLTDCLQQIKRSGS